MNLASHRCLLFRRPVLRDSSQRVLRVASILDWITTPRQGKRLGREFLPRLVRQLGHLRFPLGFPDNRVSILGREPVIARDRQLLALKLVGVVLNQVLRRGHRDVGGCARSDSGPVLQHYFRRQAVDSVLDIGRRHVRSA